MVKLLRQRAHRQEMFLKENAIIRVIAAMIYPVYCRRPASVVASGIVKMSQHAKKVSLRFQTIFRALKTGTPNPKLELFFHIPRNKPTAISLLNGQKIR